ncbi:MAG: hypothetical protein PHQ27_04130 [Victivallales bacterium]|nr:hypothetical protein [Victivallales bacterium]
MERHKKILIAVIPLMLSLGIAAAIVIFMLHGERSYLNRLRDHEIKHSLNIEETLRRTEEAVERGDELSYYYEQIKKLDTALMTQDQNLRYTILEGDLLLDKFRHAVNRKNRQIFFDLAVKQYNIAAQLTLSPEFRGELYRRIARINIENRNWSEALNNFLLAYPLIIDPQEKWSMNLAMADCLIRLHRITEAMDRINMAAGSDNRQVSCRARLEKADLLLRALDDPRLAEKIGQYLNETDPAYRRAEKANQAAAYLKQQAAAIYRDVSKKLPSAEPLYFRAQLGLLRLEVRAKEADQAFARGNRLLSGAADPETMVRVMLELAQLEEQRRRYQEAIVIVKKALQKYPTEAARLQVGLLLYDLYKKINNWNAAFSIAGTLFQNTSDPAAICKLINDFAHGEDRIFDIIIHSRDKDYYIDQLQQIYRNMAGEHPLEWEQIETNAYYVLAQLYFADNDYQQAEEALGRAFAAAGALNLRPEEHILRLDLSCAMKLAASPVVIVCRSRRYLNYYPRGPYYRHALLALLRGYFFLGLYEPALVISRKIYADELSSSDSLSEHDQVWMETIAIISQCYFKLGRSEVANRLLRNFSADFLRKKYGGEIYYTWSQMAIEQQQIPEAIRRIDVALLYTTDPGEKLKLRLAQCLLYIQVGSLKDFYAAAGLLEELERDRQLDRQWRQEFRRRLLEAMLEYALDRKMNRDFDRIFQKATRDSNGASWAQYWMLRALTPYFTQDNLHALSSKHEEILQHDASIIKDRESSEFIRTQLNLINDLIGLEQRYEHLKKTEGLDL